MDSYSLERRGSAFYLVDTTGERWRVHDVHFRGGKPHRVPMGDARANSRYFVNAAGERRACVFARDTSRAVTVDVVAEHFKSAGYVGAPFDPTSR